MTGILKLKLLYMNKKSDSGQAFFLIFQALFYFL